MLWLARNTIKPKDIKVTDSSNHRNGISGKPFTVVLFDWVDGAGTTRRMLAMLPVNDEGEYVGGDVNGECYVVDRDLLAQGIIGVGDNSWRGDHFEAFLRAAIK